MGTSAQKNADLLKKKYTEKIFSGNLNFCAVL